MRAPWRISRADRYRLVAWLNTLYPYKVLMYAIALIFGALSLANDLWFNASWDIGNISTVEYGLLSVCFIFAPACSFLADRIRQRQIALYISVASDLSMAWALFSYSMVVFTAFGFVLGITIMWGIAAGLFIYASSDILLLRLIATQPVIDRDDTDALIVAQRLQQYVGMRKWRALTEAAEAIDLLYKIDPEVFQRRSRSHDSE